MERFSLKVGLVLCSSLFLSMQAFGQYIPRPTPTPEPPPAPPTQEELDQQFKVKWGQALSTARGDQLVVGSTLDLACDLIAGKAFVNVLTYFELAFAGKYEVDETKSQLAITWYGYTGDMYTATFLKSKRGITFVRLQHGLVTADLEEQWVFKANLKAAVERGTS